MYQMLSPQIIAMMLAQRQAQQQQAQGMPSGAMVGMPGSMASMPPTTPLGVQPQNPQLGALGGQTPQLGLGGGGMAPRPPGAPAAAPGLMQQLFGNGAAQGMNAGGSQQGIIQALLQQLRGGQANTGVPVPQATLPS